MHHSIRSLLYSTLPITTRRFAFGALGAIAAVGWQAPLQAQTPESVVWHANVNTTATGSNLAKTSGAAGWNGDAVSVQTIPGDGYFEFRFNQTNKRISAGLSYTNASSSLATLDYAIVANSTTAGALAPGNIFLKVDGTNVTAGLPNFVVTDLFRVERTGTTIKFYQNGAVFYTAVAPRLSIGSVVADTSFADLNGSISACTIAGAPEESIVWERNLNLTATYTDANLGSTLAQDAVADSQSAHGTRMIHGDGYVKFRFGLTAKLASMGFAPTDPSQSASNSTHGIESTGVTNNFRCFDPSGNVYTGTFAVTDTFTIRRVGGTVTYLKNDVLLATSATPSTGRVFVESNLFTASARVENCRYGGISEGEPVAWTNLVNAHPTYDNIWPDGFRTIEKQSGMIGAWDAGAVSTTMIERAGKVEFRFGNTFMQAAMGLSESDNGVDPNTIQFGIIGLGNGTAQATESGTLVGSPVSFATSDFFAVRRADHTIYYEKNGVAFHQTSLTGSAAVNPLLVDFSLKSHVTDVIDPRVYGAPTRAAWRYLANTVQKFPNLAFGPGLTTGSTLAKTNTSNSWNAGATSETFMKGDGVFEFSASQTDKSIVVGLATTDVDTLSNFPYAIALGTGGYYVQESSVPKAGPFGYGTSDVFCIERVGDQVNYYQNGSLVYASTVSSTGYVFVDTAFHSAGDAAGTLSSIKEARIYSAPVDSDGDGMADAWEYLHFGSLDPAAQSGGPGFENDADQDGTSNLQEFINGTDPNN